MAVEVKEWMTNMRKLLLSSLAAISLLAPGMREAALSAPVSAAQLRNLAGVRTAYWKGKKARVQIFRNGTLRARQANRVDVGRWHVKGNRLCVSFKVWTHGKYKCGTLEKKGGWYVGLRNSKGVPRLKLSR